MAVLKRSGLMLIVLLSAEHIIFASWDKYPARTLPETDPTALASLISYYFEHAR